MITGKGPSNRHEIFYWREHSVRCASTAISFYRPARWLARRQTQVDVPFLTNCD
jgi:hypothetical protein